MKRSIPFLLIAVILASAIAQPAHADVAPPETVPGSNLVPGGESTQVRMAAETVTLTVSKDPADEHGAVARTEAVFTMRNLGSTAETMAARFPLSFFNGNSDGFGDFPEIENIAIKVNGKTVPTRREIQPFLDSQSSFQERDAVPWAVFDVTFPPNEDVIIEVVYDVEGYGYYPYEVFKYVLETGAGWNGTIGSADIILRLPYEASKQNVWVEGVEGYGEPTQGGQFSGNEVRWHFENLEPGFENNLQFIVVAPSLWNAILSEKETVTRDPNDGEAWGRLGKTYKEIITIRAWLRSDPAGREMFELSKHAYEQCLSLLPNDSLWHYGYAELLWAHYYWDLYMLSQPDVDGFLPTLLMHLQTALEIDPNNDLAKTLLDEIYYSVPEAVDIEGDSYVFLALTATPIPPTPYGGLTTETPQTTPEPFSPSFVLATPTVNSATTEPPPPIQTNPLCGSAFLLPVLLGMIFINRKRQ